MQNATSIYNFNNHKIRTKLFDGKIHFCGKDVCEAISIKNSKDTMSRLKEGVVITDLPTVGGVQQAKFINEPNLYKIVLQSRKPQAEPFVNWVCSEVLPSIRQTGGYVAPNGKAVVVSEHTRALPVLLWAQQLWVQRPAKKKFVKFFAKNLAEAAYYARKA